MSGTQDSEVTKSLIGSLEFFFANGHSLDACLCFVVVEQEKSIAKCLLVYVENQTNIVKQNLFQWEKLGHCEMGLSACSDNQSVCRIGHILPSHGTIHSYKEP